MAGKNADAGLCVSLSSMGYGYTVGIQVNGADIGVKGGQSESKRLFSPTHEMASEMPPDMRKTLVVLKDGPNRFVIDFKKTGGENDRLTVEIFGDGADPLFTLASSALAAGKLDRTLDFAFGKAVSVGDADLKG